MKSDHIPCQQYDFRLYQGVDFERVFTITDSYGNPVDLTNYSWEVTIGYIGSIYNDDVKTVITGTIQPSTPEEQQDAQKGLVKLRLTPSNTNNLFSIVPYGVDVVKWRLKVTSPSGQSWVVREGLVELERV